MGPAKGHSFGPLRGHGLGFGKGHSSLRFTCVTAGGRNMRVGLLLACLNHRQMFRQRMELAEPGSVVDMFWSGANCNTLHQSTGISIFFTKNTGHGGLGDGLE